jgi:hypothetical protein
MNHYIEEDEVVRYDDGFDQLFAHVLHVNGDTATIEFTAGNCRHPKKTIEEVSLSFLFSLDAEEHFLEYLY